MPLRHLERECFPEAYQRILNSTLAVARTARRVRWIRLQLLPDRIWTRQLSLRHPNPLPPARYGAKILTTPPGHPPIHLTTALSKRHPASLRSDCSRSSEYAVREDACPTARVRAPRSARDSAVGGRASGASRPPTHNGFPLEEPLEPSWISFQKRRRSNHHPHSGRTALCGAKSDRARARQGLAPPSSHNGAMHICYPAATEMSACRPTRRIAADQHFGRGSARSASREGKGTLDARDKDAVSKIVGCGRLHRGGDDDRNQGY